AGLHRSPKRRETLADLGLAAPGELVAKHQGADPTTRAFTGGQELRPAGERVGDGGAVFDDPVGAGGLFVDDEATSDRVVHALAQRLTGGVEGRELHPIRVLGQAL